MTSKLIEDETQELVENQQNEIVMKYELSKEQPVPL